MSEDPSFILWLDADGVSGDPCLGGKFANLAEMTAAGFAVPPGFGITTHAYRHFMRANDLAEEARRLMSQAGGIELSQIKAATSTLTDAIMQAPLPAELEEQIRNAYAELEQRTGVTALPVAVRSSGESEDLAGASFAGQYDTFLWVQGADSVIHHLRRCWTGMFGEAVMSYRIDGQNVIATGDYGMCVGIQQMVDARTAGVMFTLNPLNGDRSKIVMEAVWGLGEGVVKGDITPSRFMLDKVTFEILERKFALQTHEYRFDAATGIVDLCPMEDARKQSPCLDESHAVALAKQAKLIEQKRGAPQDIEWAVDAEGNVHILQVRPETVWSRKTVQSVVQEQRSPVSHVLARLTGVKLTRANGSAP